MRILSIHMNSSVNGGAEVVYIHGNRLLAEMGHQVAWLSIGASQDAVRRGELVFYLPEIPDKKIQLIPKLTRHFFNSESVRLAKQAIQEFHPDIVHVHTVFGYRYLSPSVLLPFKERGIPIVQTLHDYGLICPASFFLSRGKVCEACKGRMYYFSAMKCCMGGSFPRSFMAAINSYIKDYAYHYDGLISSYIAPSHFLRQKYIEFGFSPPKIEVIPNAYFQTDSTVMPIEIEKKSRNYLLFAGRLSSEKGVDVLVGASKGLGIPVKIVGDGPERETLQTMQGRIGADNIEFLGKQPHSSMETLYKNAALTIFPSRWYENGPLVILESFAQATPVIASRIGAIPEFVKDCQTGYLFNVDDPDDLRRTIQLALRRPHPEVMEENAYQQVHTEHRQGLYATRLENILSRHIAGSH